MIVRQKASVSTAERKKKTLINYSHGGEAASVTKLTSLEIQWKQKINYAMN
jgi:hypothetical protein